MGNDNPMRKSLGVPTDPAAYPFVHQLRVRFAETDAMGVVHHGRYLPYLEAARVEYLRAVGRPYLAIRQAGTDFAVIGVDMRYHAPLRFDDQVDVHVCFWSMSGASFEMAYLLTVDGTRTCTAITGHAALSSVDGSVQRLPTWLQEFGADVGAKES